MKKFVVLTLLGIFGCGLLDGCDHSNVETAYLIGGIVSDSSGGGAIDSAIVSWDDTLSAPRVYTDSAGVYHIQVAAGDHVLFARKSGFRTGRLELGTVNSNRANVNILLVKN